MVSFILSLLYQSSTSTSSIGVCGCVLNGFALCMLGVGQGLEG